MCFCWFSDISKFSMWGKIVKSTKSASSRMSLIYEILRLTSKNLEKKKSEKNIEDFSFSIICGVQGSPKVCSKFFFIFRHDKIFGFLKMSGGQFI